MSLSPKHQQFINEYFKCWNQTEAYRRVYPDSSDDAASANAARLIRNDRVAAEVKRRVKALTMSADEVLIRLTEHGRSDIGEFLSDDGQISLVDDKDKDDEGKPKRKRTRLIRKVIQKRTQRTTEHMVIDEVTVTLELYSAQTAMKMLGKHHGLFDTDEHGTNDDDSVTWDEAASDS